MEPFYYGSQDIPPPLGRGKPPRLRGSPPSGLCEACNRSISAEDVEAGDAEVAFGLLLCADCAVAARTEDRIELYFCDRCQVSVPVYRVDTGEALAGDGRILCVSCRLEGSRTFGSRLLLGGFFLLALTGAALFVLGPARSRERFVIRDPLPPPALVQPREPYLTDLLPRGDGDLELDSVLDRLAKLERELDRVRDAMESAGQDLTALRDEFDDRQSLLERETRALNEEIDALLNASRAER